MAKHDGEHICMYHGCDSRWPDDEAVMLTATEATALREALEEYMRHDDHERGYDAYKDRWNAADIALVPLRGGPFSNENRRMEPPAPPPAWSMRGSSDA